MVKKAEPLGGWLLFFFIIFILGAAFALMGIFQTILYPFLADNFFGSIYGKETMPMLSTSWIVIQVLLLSALLVLYIFIIVGIGKKKAWAKKLAIWTAWTAFVIVIVQQIMGYFAIPKTLEFYSNIGLEAMQQVAYQMYFFSLIFTPILSLAWAIIVTLYFVRSERVKKTLVL